MDDVILLSLAEGGGCGSACDGCGTACSLRTPVLACADALRAAGARVETVIAGSDAEIDAVVARFDGDPRPGGVPWPAAEGRRRLGIAAAADGAVRAVVRG